MTQVGGLAQGAGHVKIGAVAEPMSTATGDVVDPPCSPADDVSSRKERPARGRLRATFRVQPHEQGREDSVGLAQIAG